MNRALYLALAVATLGSGCADARQDGLAGSSSEPVGSGGVGASGGSEAIAEGVTGGGGGVGGAGSNDASGGMSTSQAGDDAGIVRDEDAGCTVVPGDHSECSGELCAFATDVVLGCKGTPYFGIGGVQVAPTPEGTVLFSARDGETFMLRASGDQGSVEEIPAMLAASFVRLANTEDGELVVLAGGNRLDVFRPSRGSWAQERAGVAGATNSRAFDFAVAADGTMHAWVEQLEQSFEHLVRGSDGTWASEIVNVEHPGAHARWGLDRAGQPVGFSFAMDEGTQLETWIADTSAPLGDARGISSSVSYAPLAPAVPHASEGPHDLGAALYSETGLSVAMPSTASPSGYSEIAVPGTAQTRTPCFRLQSANNCAEPCIDDASALAGFAVAQSSERGASDIWIVWAEVHYDLEYRYAPPDPPCTLIGECFCTTEIIDHGATGTLHVARIDANTHELTELMTLPTQPIEITEAYGGLTADRMLDARVFGDQLAIGVQAMARNPDTTLWEISELRVIQLDLSSL